jgi:putative ABC transport system permease protein
MVSGFYPALVLSCFQPVQVLKGSLQVSRKLPLRSLLVTGEFTVGIFRVIGTIISPQHLSLGKQHCR